MATERREAESSWWWAGGGRGGGGEFMFGGMTTNDEINQCHRRRELEAAIGGYNDQLQGAPMLEESYKNIIIEEQNEMDFEMYQLASYPRPRLRWTQELHDHFVKAVDELGGANKATPKAILNLMGVPGLTLYHLKSHLQKFRLGKTSKRLWRREFVPAAADCYQPNDERLPPATMVEGQASSISKTFDMNVLLNESGIKTLGAGRYGNMHVLVEVGGKKNMGVAEAISSTINIHHHHHHLAGLSKMKEEDYQFANAKPALLPLFPPMPACAAVDCPPRYSSEWSEVVEGGGVKSEFHRPMIDNNSMDDYLNYSSELFKINESRRANVRFGSFFDDVASFSKVNDNDTGDL